MYLRAEINPNRFPLEPSYADNVVTDGPFTFDTSPRLQVQFVSFGYELSGVTYYPRLVDDVFQTYSWIRRTYPLASAPGSASDPSPGFRPNLWVMFDEGLGSRVFLDPACTAAMKDNLATNPQCSNLRASAYTNISRIGPVYGLWWTSGGQSGEEPPPGNLHKVMDLHEEGKGVPAEERAELGKEIFRLNCEEVWTIGTIGLSPMVMGVIVCKNKFRNVKNPNLGSWLYPNPGPQYPCQYFWEE